MAQHSAPPLRRWISSTDQEEPEKALEGVPPRVVRLLAEGKNKVHPSGLVRGAARHGLAHVMPHGVSFRNRSKSIQPMSGGGNFSLIPPLAWERHSSPPPATWGWHSWL